MRTPITILSILLLAILSTGLAHAVLLTQGSSSLETSLLSYTPVPAQPGDVIDVYITVENSGSTSANDVRVEFLDTYPFTLDSEVYRVKLGGVIPAQESLLVKTKVRIDKNADVGTSYLRVRVSSGASGASQEQEIPIDIRGETSSLTIETATWNPKILAAGGQGTLTVVLKNSGDTLLRDIQLDLDLAGLSVSPLGDSASRAVRALAADASETLTFQVITAPDATPGVVQVPVDLSYVDDQGVTQTKEKTLGLVIGSTPELMVYFDSMGITTQALEGPVVIKIVNKGLAPVKLVELEVPEEGGVSVTSESGRLYVGNIDEDDYESAELTLKVTADTKSVPVVLRYKDSLNQAQTLRVELPLKKADANGEKNTPWGLYLLVALVVVGGGVWLLRRRNSRRKA